MMVGEVHVVYGYDGGDDGQGFVYGIGDDGCGVACGGGGCECTL